MYGTFHYKQGMIPCYSWFRKSLPCYNTFLKVGQDLGKFQDNFYTVGQYELILQSFEIVLILSEFNQACIDFVLIKPYGQEQVLELNYPVNHQKHKEFLIV